MTDLHDLLELATDRVEATGLSNGVLAAAARRRRTRRAVMASVAVVVVVTGVAVAGQLGDDAGSPEPAPAPPTQTVEPGSPRFDPRTVADLPSTTVRGLPAELDVPDLAPRVEDDPVDAAVLSVDDIADVLLLGTDGRWRCVVVRDRFTALEPVLSPDGTHLAVTVVDGVVIVDLATGEQSHRPNPSDYEPDGLVGTWWRDDERLVLRDDARAWQVDLDGGPGRWIDLPAPPGADWPMPELADDERWGVLPIAALADGAVLLRVETPREIDRPRWWIVRWDPAEDTFSLVSAVDSDPAKRASFASGLLAGR